MTPKNSFLIALALTAASAPAAAQEQRSTGCRLRIDTNATSWVIRGHDPYGGAQPSGTFDLILTNEGDQPCEVFPVFALDKEGFGLRAASGPHIPYSLLDLYGDQDATPLGGRAMRKPSWRPVVVNPHGQQAVRYMLQIPPEAITSDGLFSQNVFVEAEDRDGRTIAGRRLVLGIDVLPSAIMGLSGAFRRSNGQALVDLGELKEGTAKLPLQLHIRSTRAYRLGVESTNRGTLQLAGTDWSIPYQVAINDKVVPLTGGGSYASPSGMAQRRDNLPISFVIGDPAQKRAGTYSDTLTISISVI